jgi:transcriptional regulator with XRE-family HTH domain
MARPTKLTTELIEEISNWLKMGYYQEDAATMVGISPSTYYEWMKKGDKVTEKEDDKILGTGEESPNSLVISEDIEIVNMFQEFSEAVKKARAEAEGAHIRNIRRASDNGVWQASAWWLERSFPKKWGKRSSLELSGEGGEPIKFQISYGD